MTRRLPPGVLILLMAPAALVAQTQQGGRHMPASAHYRIRRIVAGREAISNPRLSEDPVNHAQLLVPFDERGKPAKTMRGNLKYELLEAQ